MDLNLNTVNTPRLTNLVHQVFVFLESPRADERFLAEVAGDGVVVLLEVSLVGGVTVEDLAALVTGRLLPGTEVLVDLLVGDEGALDGKGS